MSPGQLPALPSVTTNSVGQPGSHWSSQGLPVSCPHFCARPRPETYHTGYLWIPLYPSESTHPPTTFSEASPTSLNGTLPLSKLTRLPSSQTLRTPTCHQLRTLVMAGLELLRRTTPINNSSSPNTGGEGVYNQWIHYDLIVIF